ncbi:MAG: PQQ-dependent sugar dehydrogenase [Flammeovirgaceae bacterium]
MKKIYFFAFLWLGLAACQQNSEKNSAVKVPAKTTAMDVGTISELPIHKIKLPPGFKMEVFATGIKNARSLAISPKGVVYVGNRSGDKVYAIKDVNKDHRADKTYVLAKGLKMPNGVAFRDGDLYVAEVNRILKFANIEANLANPPKPEIIFDNYPSDRHHGWKFIAFGPDGKLYVPVGAPCNVCERDKKVYSSITRLNADGTNMEVFAHGVRNSVGFDWHPDTKELWFTDNGRDMMGDDMPSDELNHAPKKGMHFGFPYCHQGNTSDPEYGDYHSCSEFTPPKQFMGAHVAALGMRFYTGKMFPKKYHKAIFIAQHGSWNRSSKVGYRVMVARLEGNKVVSYEPFATGWLEGETAWGRPVDVQQLADGSLLVSDDYADAIYRIYYSG